MVSSILTTECLIQRAMFPSDAGVRSVAPKIPMINTRVLTTIVASFVQGVIREFWCIRHIMRIGCLAVPSLASITTGCSVDSARVIPAKIVIATATLCTNKMHGLNTSGGAYCYITVIWIFVLWKLRIMLIYKFQNCCRIGTVALRSLV